MTTTTQPTPPGATPAPCARCGAHLERDDLRCPVCAFLVPVASGDTPAEGLQVFRCDGCGAAMAWSAEKRALACGFCGGAVHAERIEDPLEQTEGYLPFTVDAPSARLALLRWMKSLGWFRPSDLVQGAHIDALKPVMWPAWRVDARATCTWAADSNAGAGRAAWAPHAGRFDLDFDGLLVGASRGLSEREMATLGEATRFDVAALQRTPPPLPGLVDESFDVQRSVARERVAVACETIALERVRQGHIPGNRYRKVKVALVLQDLRTRRVSLPAWILAYRYDDVVYRVVIHGQDHSVVIGQAPWSKAKIALAALGGVALLALVAVIASLLQHR